MLERVTIPRIGPIEPNRAEVPLPKKSAAAVAASAIPARMLKVRAKTNPSCGEDGTATTRETRCGVEGTGEQGADGQPVESLHGAPQCQ